jgi:alpha-mannosidase
MAAKRLRVFLLFICGTLCLQTATAQQNAYFIDGFHGGLWGHYPEGYTKYIVGVLKEHPDWRINLEIEPETWDREKAFDPEAYTEFKSLYENQINNGLIEYVNPAYGQSYTFNTSAESTIRQLYYGMKMLRVHFPKATFNTYSSEEPCYTSALPQILTSFGIKYASLKNPNTCWGGYTRAHGGELVYWTGPDGSRILTVPRYAFEKLKPNSTWETIASGNSPEYINAAFDAGLKYPIGMCLQDAGWTWGPWLKGKQYKPSIYTTWQNYFENILKPDGNVPEWKLNNEDVQVSLVWGSQILQQLARKVRTAENNIVQAEKVAVMHMLLDGTAYPSAKIDVAWQSLLLAQHHDCWIVPYNRSNGNNWADKVTDWTGITNATSNAIIEGKTTSAPGYIKVYNTSGYSRTDYVTVAIANGFKPTTVSLTDENKQKYTAEVITDGVNKFLKFKAGVPAFGFKVFKIENTAAKSKSAISFKSNKNIITVETGLYKITFDTKKGGAITSLIAKKLDNKEFADQAMSGQFSGLRGNFYNDGGLKSTFNERAEINVKAQGENFIEVEVVTKLMGTVVTKAIALTNDNPRIDFNLIIDWKENIGIGSFDEKDNKEGPIKKAFYNDSNKLVTVFPLNLKGQRVFKNAPFDVMESGHEDTFFDRWDSIKNNIIVNWVDVTDADAKYGCALLTDHTTTYTHGKDFPLGLTVQYSGAGLWSQGYTINGPTEINYALIPHKGNWQQAELSTKSRDYEEPLRGELLTAKPALAEKSFVTLDQKGWELVSAEERDGSLYIRIFNAEGDAAPGKVTFGFNPGTATLVKLNGEEDGKVAITKTTAGYEAALAMPQFGFRTLKISTVNK